MARAQRYVLPDANPFLTGQRMRRQNEGMELMNQARQMSLERARADDAAGVTEAQRNFNLQSLREQMDASQLAAGVTGAQNMQRYLMAGDLQGAIKYAESNEDWADMAPVLQSLGTLAEQNPQEMERVLGGIMTGTQQIIDAFGPQVSNTVEPASVREWRFYNSLPDEEKPNYLDMKRGGMSFEQIAGGLGFVNANNPQQPPLMVTTPQQERDAAAARESVVAGARQEQETLGTRERTMEARQQQWIDRALPLAESVPVIRRNLELLRSVETGGLNAISLAAKQRLGIEGADEGELANQLGKNVLSQLRETFGSQFTAEESKQLERIEAGFGKSTETNVRLLNQALQIMERKIDRGIRAAEILGDFDTADELRATRDQVLESGGQSRFTIISVEDG